MTETFDYNPFWTICYTEDQREEFIKHNAIDPITRAEFDELRKIIDYIASRNRLVNSQEISEVFNIEETTTGWPRTRAMIKDGMRHYASIAGIPIGAKNTGYFLIQDVEELRKYCDNLQNRINGMEERITLVRDAWKNQSVESSD